MSALRQIQTAPDDAGRVFDAIADAIAMAGGYTEIAAQAAQLRDPRVLAYGLRCATTALVTAAEMAAEVRPAPQRGGRAA